MPRSSNPVIIIPARMASTRLPNKPLADIGGKPMIVQVWQRAMEAGVGDVVVACDGTEIAEAVEAAGGKAVLTDPELPSGSDRVWQALQKIDPEERYDVVINLQGDMPTLDPEVVRQALASLSNLQTDIATLAAEITREDERTNPAVVKVVIGENIKDADCLGTSVARTSDQVGAQPQRRLSAKNKTALYFSRATVPYGDGPLYHHIGIYVYRRAALERFVSLPPSPLEQREKLEQLRALESGMQIGIAIVDTVPLGVDTQAQLEEARSKFID